MSRIVVSQFVSAHGVIEDPVLGGDPATEVGRLRDSPAATSSSRAAVGEGVAILVYQPARD
jgi:hypothetical protein